MTPLERARALYVELATRPERTKIAMLERRRDRAPTAASVAAAQRLLQAARAALAAAQKMAGEIFDEEIK